MWAILAAAALMYGLARAAAAEPAHRRTRQLGRLERLCAVPRDKLTSRQAEDGAVLARKLGHADLARTFERDVHKLRRSKK